MRQKIVGAIDGYRRFKAGLARLFLVAVTAVLALISAGSVVELTQYVSDGRELAARGRDARAVLTAIKGPPIVDRRGETKPGPPVYQLEWQDGAGATLRTSVGLSDAYRAKLAKGVVTTVPIRYVSDAPGRKVRVRILDDAGRLGQILQNIGMMVAGTVGAALLARYTWRRQVRSVEEFIPKDQPLDMSSEMTADDWRRLETDSDDEFLRQLYARPLARNRIADEAAEGPARSFDEFKAQVERALAARALARA